MENFNRQLVLANTMTVDISFADGRLSICGETEDSAGQIIGELEDLLKYGPNEQQKTIIVKLRDIWERWHLNDMRPGCEHQRAWNTSEKIEIVSYRLTREASKQQNQIKRQAETDLKETGTATISDLNRELLSLPWQIKKDPAEVTSLFYRDCYEEHERETKTAGWVYPSEHPKGLLCKPCEVCGYKYGSAWLKEEVPADVLDYLKTLGAPA